MSLFAPRDQQRSAASRQVREWSRALLAATEDDTVVVSELRCTEPGCPPLETMIALLRPGHEPRKTTIHKAVTELTEADVRSALLRLPPA
jgi:hypothetical protein